MGILTAIGSALNLISAPATEWFKGKAEYARVKQEGKLKIELAKIEALVAAASREGDHNLTYDMKVLDNMKTTWKDEFLLVIFSFPFTISFLAPFVDELWGLNITPKIAQSWQTVGLAPDWYQWVMIGIVAATFGLRWLFSRSNPLSNKKAP